MMTGCTKLAGDRNGTASELCSGLLYDKSSHASQHTAEATLGHRYDYLKERTMTRGTQGTDSFEARLASLINKRRVYMQARQTVTKRLRDESDLLGDLFRANERMFAHLYRLLQQGPPPATEPRTSSTPQRLNSAAELEHQASPSQLPPIKSDSDSWLVDPSPPARRASAPEYRPARSARTAPVRPPKSPPSAPIRTHKSSPSAPDRNSDETEPSKAPKAFSKTIRQSHPQSSVATPQVRYEALAASPPETLDSARPSSKLKQKSTSKVNTPNYAKPKAHSPGQKILADLAPLSATVAPALGPESSETRGAELVSSKAEFEPTKKAKPKSEPQVLKALQRVKDEPLTQRETPLLVKEAPQSQHLHSSLRSKGVQRYAEPDTEIAVNARADPSQDALTQPPLSQITKKNSSHDDGSVSTGTSPESDSKIRKRRRRKRPRLSLDELNEPDNTPNQKLRASAPAAGSATPSKIKESSGVGGASSSGEPHAISTSKCIELANNSKPYTLSENARRLKQLFGSSAAIDDEDGSWREKVQSPVKFTPKRSSDQAGDKEPKQAEGVSITERGLGIAGYSTPGQVDRAVRALNAQRQRRARGVAAKETVLGHARKALEGYTCAECVAFFQAEAASDPNPEKRLKELLRHCRHKAVKPPPQTPDGYYDLTFPETQTQPPLPPPPPAPLRELNRK